MTLIAGLKPTPRSESPRKTRRDGTPIKMGFDGRDKTLHNARGANENPFLDGAMGHGKHVGDGLQHNQKAATSAAIQTKPEIPADDSTGSHTPPYRDDGDESKVRRHDWGGPGATFNGEDKNAGSMQVAQPVSGGAREAEHHAKTWQGMFDHVDPPAHPGFKAVQSKIASERGISKYRAGAILGSATRNASAAAKRANPRLKRVKG